MWEESLIIISEIPSRYERVKTARQCHDHASSTTWTVTFARRKHCINQHFWIWNVCCTATKAVAEYHEICWLVVALPICNHISGRVTAFVLIMAILKPMCLIVFSNSSNSQIQNRTHFTLPILLHVLTTLLEFWSDLEFPFWLVSQIDALNCNAFDHAQSGQFELKALFALIKPFDVACFSNKKFRFQQEQRLIDFSIDW